jgi:hypothetical protein
VQCAVCSVQCAVRSVQCAMCSVQCAVCSVQCAVCSVQSAVCMANNKTSGAAAKRKRFLYPDKCVGDADAAHSDSLSCAVQACKLMYSVTVHTKCLHIFS